MVLSYLHGFKFTDQPTQKSLTHRQNITSKIDN